MDSALHGNGESLPDELFSKIFEYLSHDRYHAEITSCRLVSHRWCELRSPFLIHTAVIADHLDTLQKLQEVLEHPYFSKHVTRLIRDGSRFPGFDSIEYETERRSDYARWRLPAKIEFSATRRIDLASIESLLRNVPNRLEPVSRPISPREEEWRQYEREWDETESQQRGFLQYHRRYQHQTWLYHHRVSLRFLPMAFQKLPNLRHFEYTDFRALSRNGETFADLHTRLFGPTICPSLLFDEPPERRFPHADRFTSWSPVYDCLQELLKISPKLESLRFGQTNFHGPDIFAALRTPLLPFDEKHIPQDSEKWRQMLSHINYLGLPVRTWAPRSHEGPREFALLEDIVGCVRKISSYSEASLEHLELVTTPFSGYPPTMDPFRGRAEPILGQTLGRLHLQKLQTVVLRGWFFSLRDIQDFLLKHRTTLREVHIIDCALTDSTEVLLRETAEDVLGSALKLTGVEVCGLASNAATSPGFSTWDVDYLHLSQGCAVHWSLGRHQTSCYEIGRGPKPKSGSEQFEVERALMGGRRNRIQRVIGENATRRYDEWWTEYTS